MLASGVMPMPPATSTALPGSSRSSNSFFGGSTCNVWPTCTRSCMKREPPRPWSSRRTAITYSVGEAQASGRVEKLISE